ncbi:TrmH family RNA methyltransferase [Chamaesiphon sp. VAR_48_metabat_135_sub]|uniref:TrmH family RNA methyltransferase n=1 Tax=Chamaesiphon sp. VAR_48_metabat_135_sub TaxID=2964699 RepID=UPI0037BE60DA
MRSANLNDYPRSIVIFLGEERQGLTSQQRRLVRIPMVREADSLNLEGAGSLLL